MNDLVFKEKYQNLNKSQKLAVDTIEGPVMVVAGPGTGKTTILTLRIANILRETDTPPSGILALTFTDAGAKVMRQKLREIIGGRADEVKIHTFHGFAASIIAEFDDHFPHLSCSKQITEVEAESLVREILKEKKYAKLRPLGDPDFYVGKILSGIKDCKKEAWIPDVVKSFAKEEIERVKNDENYLSSRGPTKGQLKAEGLKRIERCERTILFAEVYESYEAKKRQERKMDFDDLLFELLLALRNDELLLQLLQEKYLYLLIDEHQDTNDSQNLIVTLLANFFESPNIFVVGDEKQAIYRFQGASVENFLRFQKIWQNMKLIPLTNNYRSHQSILDASFKMIENNYAEGEHADLRVALKSEAKHTEKPIEIIEAGNVEAGDAFLIEALLKIHKEKPEETVAVIVRKNREVEHILTLCEINKIPASAERGTDVFTNPIGVLYFGLLEYLLDPTKTELLAEGLSVGLWGLDFKRGAELTKKLRSGEVEIQKEIPALREFQKEITQMGVLEFLIQAGEVSGFTKLTFGNPVYAEVWRSIIELARDLASRGQIEDPRVLIRELLAYKATAETKSIKVGGGRVDAQVHILTAHGSKGLEYDRVFLPFATEESWMRGKRTPPFVFPREKDEGDEIKDARRLFYVALTRAKREAVIIVPEEEAGGRLLTPLRFIAELDENHLKRVSLKARKELPQALTLSEIKSQRKLELVEYAKRVILENGLSVTALNHFAVCPSQFLYKSILKVPEAPSATSEKGIAMHKALSFVWQEKERDVKTISQVIKNTVKDYFETSLLPKLEKEIIVEELLKNAPIVAEALKEYFNKEAEVSTETWKERVFETTFKKKPVEFNLHGQLDAILEFPKKVEVYDYKTREAMSENAIKGETKDADGNYFRQLIFYKILLENHFKEKTIEPALIFIKPDSKGRCPTIFLPITKEDTDRVLGEVETLVQSVWSGEFMEGECDNTECTYCAYKKLMK